MSGGYFDYQQFYIGEIADKLEKVIADEMASTPDGDANQGLSADTLQAFTDALCCLRKAQIYAHRIDWLLSGDDGEPQFLSRLDSELYQLHRQGLV